MITQSIINIHESYWHKNDWVNKINEKEETYDFQIICVDIPEGDEA